VIVAEGSSERLVQISGLTITYSPEGSSPVRAVRNATLGIRPGEVVGILGESGSGKSTLASALLRLLPATAHYGAGSILFRGRDLLSLSEHELRMIRGKEIALVSQDPALTLNPVMRVGDQISEAIRAHEDVNSRERRERVYNLLGELGFEQPQEIYVAYPHQLSGGQRQRIAIAQAIACRPALVIADEPTSKLDSSLQAEIIALLSEIRRRYGTALLVISHDPTIFAGFADRIAIMYTGRIVEEGNTKDIFRKPLHPYTQALVRLCTEHFMDAAANRARLSAIEGEAADLSRDGVGCPFEPRCPERMPVCTSVDPRELLPEPSHRVSCFKYGN
jgi:oligopeptide/dipeptide ABC transporter ATP-binding protein